MPLEQIGASLQLLHSSKGTGGGSSVYDSGHRGRGTDHSDTYGDEERAEAWTTHNTPNPALDDSHESSSYVSNSRLGQHKDGKGRRPLQNEDMVLHKLGGVGGVQRSGSARYAQHSSGRANAGSAILSTDEEEEVQEPNAGIVQRSQDSSADQSVTSPPTGSTSLRRIGLRTSNTSLNELASPSRESMVRSPDVAHSPRRRGRTLIDGEAARLPPSPSLGNYAVEVRSKIDTLSLTAAAQAQRQPSSRSSFVPQEPRRHTGSFALRSRSALAQTLGSASLNFGNGLGRAASRRHANAPPDSEGDQVGSGNRGPDTPRANAVRIENTAPTPGGTVRGVAPSTLSAANSGVDFFRKGTLTGNRSTGVSPRTRIVDLIMSPALPQRTLTVPADRTAQADGSPATFPAAGDYFDGGNAGQSTAPQEDAVARLRSPLLSPSSDSPPPSSPFEAELSAFAAEPLPVSRGGGLGVYDGNQAGGSSPYLTASNGRPSMTARLSASVLSTGGGVNVLRTPTTEEWSRYLINQGLDPMQLSAAGDGVRSRSNTARSVQRARGRTSERDWSLMSSTSMSSIGQGESGADATVHEADEGVETLAADGQLPVRRAHRRSSSIAVADPSIETFAEKAAIEMDDEEDDEEDHALAEEMERDLTQMPLNRQTTLDGSSGSDEYSSDELDEHMRVLNEIISRPPSRLGTPAPSESGQEKLTGSVEALRSLDPRRGRWPQRETAAVLSDYPLLPLGEQRSINDFIEVDDIGRGAYGLVKKVRLRDERSGEAVGSEFCIKYIIKSRILADCWRRHKLLGPIPVEIHVLDQLRRLSYVVTTQPAAWSAEKLFGLPPLIHAAAKDESDHLVAVGHPSLCMMVDFFEDHEFYYLVMPCFGRGQDLFDYVESQPLGLNTRQVRCIFGQLADGLSFLHANNIVHRDVKDENVILDGKGNIQLIDFGSAAHINTRNGGRLFDTFSGTLDYAAAEILRGEKYGGKEQDVWALGVVGYVLLCGDCPFWNGEEAMHGLQPDTRACNVLAERCRASLDRNMDEESVSQPVNEEKAGKSQTACVDGFTGQVYQKASGGPTGQANEVEAERRHEDSRGQADGGGRLQDAADLIMQCVQLNPLERPTMEQICQHRFLAGAQGWLGLCGWAEDGQGARFEAPAAQQQEYGEVEQGGQSGA